LNNLERKKRGHVGKSEIRKDEQREDPKAAVFGKFPEPGDKEKHSLRKNLKQNEKERFYFLPRFF
jgi:hypothetical protein